MTKTTARHRAPLTARGRLTRLWSTLSVLPVGALAGCVAVGAATAAGTPAVGALGLVALAPATVATVTGWRTRLTDPVHGRRSAGRTSSAPRRPVTVRLTALLEPATDGSRASSRRVAAPPMATAPRLARPMPASAAAHPALPAPAPRSAPAGRLSPFGPVRSRPMLALGTSSAAARTPIVLDVPDLAALQLATGQEALWHGRTGGPAETDPSRLFTVSSSRGTVEVVVLTRAERAARDLQVLDALEAAQAVFGGTDHADVVTEIARSRRARPRREDGGSVASAA